MQKTKGISLEQALSMADDNRGELEKVLEQYKNDSLKLEAARFLIQNMPYHFSRVEYFVSPKGERYVPDITDFADKQAVEKHCNSLLREGYTIRKENVYDVKNLSSDYLIRNIDLAFESWQKPWAKEVSFNDFCQYILPYRAQNEPVSHLRETLMRRYMPLLDSIGAKNPLDACRIINEQLSKEIRYAKTGSSLASTIEETYHAQIGTCEALCNYTTTVMRSVGIPVAVMQTTWTRLDFVHYWCAVLHEGKFYDFDSGGKQPDIYQHILATSAILQPSKVYRRHYDADLSVLRDDDDGYVTQLKNPLFTDVTQEEEMPTYTLCVPTEKKTKGKSKQAYLCTYNDKKWRPIAIGKREKDSCRFEKVAGRNILIVAEAVGKNELQYISAPFLTDDTGGIRLFESDLSQTESVVCRRYTKHGDFPLSYWDVKHKRFISVDFQSRTDSTLCYENIPAHALLLCTFSDGTDIWQLTGLAIDRNFKHNREI